MLKLENIVNWSISAAFHIGLIFIFIFIFMPNENKVQAHIPPDTIFDVNPPNMIPSQDPSKFESEQDDERFRPKLGEVDRPTVDLKSDKDEPLVIGIGPSESGLKEGIPNGLDIPTHELPPMTPPARAKSIVFLLDKSGSMFDHFDFVKSYLSKVIKGLNPTQSFEIIFFSEKTERWSRNLVRATNNSKNTAIMFMTGVTPEGQTNPKEAIKRGLSLKPQMLYILSDGEFDQKVVDYVRSINNGTQINTYVYEYGFVANNLKQIAEQNNGIYKNIKQDDLKK